MRMNRGLYFTRKRLGEKGLWQGGGNSSYGQLQRKKIETPMAAEKQEGGEQPW